MLAGGVAPASVLKCYFRMRFDIFLYDIVGAGGFVEPYLALESGADASVAGAADDEIIGFDAFIAGSLKPPGDTTHIADLSGRVFDLHHVLGSDPLPGSGGSGSHADPCATATLGTGYNCGTARNGGDPNTLYDCVSSRLQSQRACPSGCQVEAVGTPDHCISTLPPPAVDPCAEANLGTGYNCGTARNGGDPNTLYDCVGSHLQSQQACPSGCQVQAVGTPDRCVSTTPPPSIDPCAKANLGTGYNCGTSSNGGDPDTLYYCVSSRLSSSRACALGCSINAVGTPDKCRTCPRNQTCPN